MQCLPLSVTHWIGDSCPLVEESCQRRRLVVNIYGRNKLERSALAGQDTVNMSASWLTFALLPTFYVIYISVIYTSDLFVMMLCNLIWFSINHNINFRCYNCFACIYIAIWLYHIQHVITFSFCHLCGTCIICGSVTQADPYYRQQGRLVFICQPQWASLWSTTFQVRTGHSIHIKVTWNHKTTLVSTDKLNLAVTLNIRVHRRSQTQCTITNISSVDTYVTQSCDSALICFKDLSTFFYFISFHTLHRYQIMCDHVEASWFTSFMCRIVKQWALATMLCMYGQIRYGTQILLE